MNKKRLLITLAISTALAVPFSAFAATSDTTAAKSIRGFFGIDTAKLTDTQKDDIEEYAKKAADLQKDFLNKMVENGTITREQADAQIKRIEDNLAGGLENGVIPGFGFSQNLKGKGGFDKRSTFIKSAIDTSKLTEQQKAELSDIYKKIADVQKENVNKMIANGLITKEQGEECIKKIDSIINNSQKVGVSDGLRMFNGFGGFNFFNIKGVGNSNLTDQQKTDMQETADKMKNLQKELINKLVSFEVMTKEQGDAIISRIDSLENMDSIKTFEGKMNGKGMIKGRFDGRGEMKNRTGNIAPGTAPSTAPSTTPVTPTVKS